MTACKHHIPSDYDDDYVLMNLVWLGLKTCLEQTSCA